MQYIVLPLLDQSMVEDMICMLVEILLMVIQI